MKIFVFEPLPQFNLLIKSITYIKYINYIKCKLHIYLHRKPRINIQGLASLLIIILLILLI